MASLYLQLRDAARRQRELYSSSLPRRRTAPAERQAPLPALRTVALSDLLSRSRPQYSWLIEPLLPLAGVMGLAGEPGTAKTWLLLELARAVAAGRPFLERFATQQGTVLIIDEENGEARLQRRLTSLTNGQPTDTPVHIASMCGLNLSQDPWIDSLYDKLAEIRPSLLLFDSLVRVHRGEENSAQDISRLFAVLTSLRQEFSCAVVFSHHLRKTGLVRDMGQRVRGSSDILAYVDSMLGLTKIETTYTLSHLKNRDGETIRPLSLRVEDTSDTTTVIRVTGEADEETGKKEQARDIILDDLADGPRLREDLTALTAQAGISPRTFAAALKELETASLIFGSLEGRKKKYALCEPLQPLQHIYSGLHALQGSGPDGDGDPGEPALPPSQPLQFIYGTLEDFHHITGNAVLLDLEVSNENA